MKKIFVEETLKRNSMGIEGYELEIKENEGTELASIEDIEFWTACSDPIEGKFECADGVYEWYEVWEYDELAEQEIIVEFGYIAA